VRELLFLVVFINFWNSETAAQRRTQLPAELTENSSPAKIVAWLDKMNFANARIGLMSGDPVPIAHMGL